MAAAGGDLDGMYRYGICLRQGVGGAADAAQAAAFLRRGADLGHRECQFEIGAILADTADGRDEAMRYLAMAAGRGHTAAGALWKKLGRREGQ